MGAFHTVTVQELVEGTQLPHLSSVLVDESLAKWTELARPALLQHLKQRGVQRLVERQALANAFARSQRGEKPDWKAPPPTSTKPPMPSASSIASAGPPKPQGPVFDSATFLLDATAAASSQMKAPNDVVRKSIQRALLSNSAEYEKRDGLVCLPKRLEQTLAARRELPELHVVWR